MEKDLMKGKAALVAFGTALGAILGWKGILLLAWAGVMGLDYISGTIAACKAGQWESRIAREGLWHKSGMILVVTVAAVADWLLVVTAEQMALGLPWPGVLLPLTLAWYILTELGSVLENAVKMGAAVPVWLVKVLKAGVRIVDAAAEEELQQEV